MSGTRTPPASATGPRRVVLTGSESVGKTTLAGRLAAHFGVPLVPEYVRGYAEAKGAPLDFTDHGPIARGQIAAEDAVLADAVAAQHPVIVLDTDLMSTVAYCHHYFGRCPAFLESLARERRADLYLLLDIDVPWVADGVRDRGDRREAVQALFRETLKRLGAPVTLIRGSWDERLATARLHMERLFSPR